MIGQRRGSDSRISRHNVDTQTPDGRDGAFTQQTGADCGCGVVHPPQILTLIDHRRDRGIGDRGDHHPVALRVPTAAPAATSSIAAGSRAVNSTSSARWRLILVTSALNNGQSASSRAGSSGAIR